jgi:hypothetical protein
MASESDGRVTLVAAIQGHPGVVCRSSPRRRRNAAAGHGIRGAAEELGDGRAAQQLGGDDQGDNERNGGLSATANRQEGNKNKLYNF